jgi:hypothetical protein
VYPYFLKHDPPLLELQKKRLARYPDVLQLSEKFHNLNRLRNI